MQAKIGFSTARGSLAFTDIGFNFLTFAYIRLRAAKDVPDVLYAIEENITVGGSANVVASMGTEWFTLSHNSVYRCRELLGTGMRNLGGMTGEFDISDGIYFGFGNGKVDIKFGVVTSSGEYPLQTPARMVVDTARPLTFRLLVLSNLITIALTLGIIVFGSPTFCPSGSPCPRA